MGQCMVHQLMPGFPWPSPVPYRAVNATPCCVSLAWFQLLILLSLLRFYSKLCYCPQKNFLADGALSKIFSEKAAGILHCLAVGSSTGIRWYGSSVVSSHGCAKDEIVYKPIEKLFTHYPQWVRRKQFRQEVTFCVVKMVLSSVYRKFSSKILFILWIYSWLCGKFCEIEGNICFLSVTWMRFFCLHVFLLQHCSRLVSSRWTRTTLTLASL